MTVSSTTGKSGPYNGNGVTVAFEYEFRILDATHVTVILNSAGAETVLTLADYSVAGVGAQGGGSVVLNTPPETGETITLVRNAPFTQPLDLENQGAYYAETVERAFDLAAMRDQQLAEQIERSVKIPVSADAAELDNLISAIVRIDDSADEIDTVAGIAGDVTAVAGIADDVSTVAGIAADVSIVAAIPADVTKVAAIDDAVSTVAGIEAEIIAVPAQVQVAEDAKDSAEAAAALAAGYAAGVNLPAVIAGDAGKTLVVRGDEAGYELLDRGAAGSPIFILATGQSNIALHPALAWTPPANLYLWDGHGSALGTAFTAMDATTINSAYSYAAEVAKANPSRNVYLLNIGQSAQPISKWMTGSPTPDLYAACKTNIEAALAVLGLSQITEFYWWQGESDYLASSTTYIANFETVIARFRAESWFPRTTPITIMGVSEYYSITTGLKDFNHVLRQVCANEPSLRTFVNTSLLPITYWEAAQDYIHMNAAGYQLAGKLAYVAVSRGTSQNDVGYWKTVVKGTQTARANTATTANDPDLRFPVKQGRQYQAKFRIVLADFSVGGAADFKWDIAGPTPTLIAWNSKYVSQVAPTVPVFDMGVVVPVGKTVLVSGPSYVFLDIDVLFSSPATNGELIFKWAQNASNAGSLSVLGGSYVEYFDIGT